MWAAFAVLAGPLSLPIPIALLVTWLGLGLILPAMRDGWADANAAIALRELARPAREGPPDA